MVNGIYQWRKRRNSGLTEIYFKKPIKNDWLIYTKDLSVCPTLTSFSSSKNTSYIKKSPVIHFNFKLFILYLLFP